MNIKIINLTPEYRNKWAQFVMQHPNGFIFQMPEIMEIYNYYENSESIGLLAIDESTKQIYGGVIGVIIVEKPGAFSKVSTRAII